MHVEYRDSGIMTLFHENLEELLGGAPCSSFYLVERTPGAICFGIEEDSEHNRYKRLQS